MSWRTFWKIFLVVQLAGVSLAILGIVHNFFAVIAGMALLFPASLIVSAQTTLGAASFIVAIMLAINVVFWIGVAEAEVRKG